MRPVFKFFYTGFLLHQPQHVVIVPGFGGSVLRDAQKKNKVWPPSPSLQQSKPLEVEWLPGSGCRSLTPLETLPVGNCQGIRVDSPFTYMLTKNSFYYPLIEKLQKHNATVSALPYDFRLMDVKRIGDDFLRFFDAQKYPSVVICHSLGGLLFHHFLVTRTDAVWQRKHLSRIYFINVPFGGCPEALFTILKSARWEGPVRIPLLSYRVDTLHHFAGLYWCLPMMNTGKPLLRSLRNEWHADNDFRGIFRELPAALDMYQNISRSVLAHRKKPLAVPTFIVYGTNITTPVFTDESSKTRLYEEGDGVVPLSSLLFCQAYLVGAYYIQIRGMAHDRVIDCLGLFDFIGQNALAPKNATWRVDVTDRK